MFWSILLLSLLLILWFTRARPVTLGPSTIPYIGHLHLLISKRPVWFDWNFEMTKKYDYRSWAITLPFGVKSHRIVSPECVKYVLNDNFDNYVKNPKIEGNTATYELFGNGIFAVDGLAWREQRKVASHMFSTRVLRDHMERVFTQHGQTFVSKLGQLAETGAFFDIQDLYFRFTMDSICDVAFGVQLGSLEMDAVPEFSKCFDQLQELILVRMQTFKPQYKFQKLFQLGYEKEITRCARVLDDFVQKVILDREQKMKSEVTQGEDLEKHWENSKWTDLLSLFFQRAIKTKEVFTPRQLRDVVINFMIAGRDTTATLVTWATYELTQHPDLCEKLVKEVDEVHGTKPPSHETVKHLSYMHAFLNEILRLHPPVPADIKSVLKDDTLPDGTRVYAGNSINYSPYIFGRLTSIWGPDAETLRPERWLEMKEEPSQYQFIAFNAGPRLCLGKQMAYLEAKMLLTMLLQNFTVSLKPNHSVQYRVSLILQMKHGLLVNVNKRVK